MLSRVADALFWMSRYLERAENVARMLDVAFHLDIDLSGIVEAEYDVHWACVLTTLQQPADFRDRYKHLSHTQALMRWLTHDGENPNGIAACVARSRLNARGVRGRIPDEVWRELNKLYWQLREPEFIRRTAESPSEFYAAVEDGIHGVQGACDSLMPHDEGWHFIQLGKFLERAEVVTRAVDVHHELLRELTDETDLPLANLHWAGVLRACAAHHAYQRVYVGRVEPARVVELLLTDAAVPRSTRFSLEAAGRALGEISFEGPRAAEGKAERLLGRALSDLKYADLGSILGKDTLHEFLTEMQRRIGEIGLAVKDQYSA